MYQGSWRDNSKNGVGVETLANGEKFEGEFQNSLRHGKGLTVRGETYKHRCVACMLQCVAAR